MVDKFVAGLVALVAFAGAGRVLAAESAPESAARHERSDIALPAECRQKNRNNAQCLTDPSVGVLARVWSRDPNESPAKSEAVCASRERERMKGAPRVQTLRYEVCNLHPSNGLYFQWVAAGFQSGSAQEDLLRNHECVCYDRDVAEATSDTLPFEANKSLKRFDLTTWHPKPSTPAEHLFDLYQTLRVFVLGPDRGGQSRPKQRFWMGTRRDDSSKVATEVFYEDQARVLVALPRLSPAAEARLLEQVIIASGFKKEEARIVPAGEAVRQIAENDRPSVAAAFEPRQRVLVLTRAQYKTVVKYEWTSDAKVFANLPIAIADMKSGRLLHLIYYSTVDEE